jgi:hypothetical protein
MRLLLLCFIGSLAVMGCSRSLDNPFFDGNCKVATYLPLSELRDIKNLPPQAVENGSSIALKGNLFFMLEPNKGIHVFDLTDTTQIQDVTFWRIPAVESFALSGDRLYASSWRDLVTIDISDIMNIKVVDRQSEVFEPLLYPPLYSGPFICVDETKGAVVGWRDTIADDVRCIADQ